MNETPTEAVELVLTVLFGALLLLVFASVVVVLMVMQRDRRNRHRAELAELQVRHAEEVRRVEQEMMRDTLTEVGRELHDNIGQLLTVVRMGLNAIARNATNGEPAARVKGDLDTIIAEVRRLSKSLNTDRFAQRSLGQVIAEECQPGQRQQTDPVPPVPGGPEQRPEACTGHQHQRVPATTARTGHHRTRRWPRFRPRAQWQWPGPGEPATARRADRPSLQPAHGTGKRHRTDLCTRW
jgi:hypothetical protein